MVKFHDGMLGTVVEAGKRYLYIATRQEHAIDRLTLGFYPKPKYEQIGIYEGDTNGIKEGAIVEVYFRKMRRWKDIFTEMSIKDAIKEIGRSDNIERVVLVKQGHIENMWQSFKEYWKI